MPAGKHHGFEITDHLDFPPIQQMRRICHKREIFPRNEFPILRRHRDFRDILYSIRAFFVPDNFLEM